MKKILFFIVGLLFGTVGTVFIFAGAFFYYTKKTSEQDLTPISIQDNTLHNASITIQVPENLRSKIKNFQYVTVALYYFSTKNFDGMNRKAFETKASFTESNSNIRVNFLYDQEKVNSLIVGEDQARMLIILFEPHSTVAVARSYPRAKTFLYIDKMSSKDHFDFGSTDSFFYLDDLIEKDCPDTMSLRGKIKANDAIMTLSDDKINYIAYLNGMDTRGPIALPKYINFPDDYIKTPHSTITKTSDTEYAYSIKVNLPKFRFSNKFRNVVDQNKFLILSCEKNERFEDCITRLKKDPWDAATHVASLIPIDHIPPNCFETNKDYTLN